METNRTINISNQPFSYLIKIQIGPHIQPMLIVNNREVPQIILETIAKEKINKKINELYVNNKTYRLQSSDQYFNKMIKQSDFEIEDLNNIEIYDLNLKFENESIQNNLEENKESKTFQSSMNNEKEGIEIEERFPKFRINDV